MTDNNQEQTQGGYGDRPEVETTDTQVVQGADGPPADEPAEPVSYVGISAEDGAIARSATQILDESAPDLQARARYLAGHDDRPTALTVDDAVEVPNLREPGDLSEFTQGFSAGVQATIENAQIDGYTIEVRIGDRTIRWEDQWPRGDDLAPPMLTAFRRAVLQAEERIEEEMVPGE